MDIILLGLEYVLCLRNMIFIDSGNFGVNFLLGDVMISLSESLSAAILAVFDFRNRKSDIFRGQDLARLLLECPRNFYAEYVEFVFRVGSQSEFINSTLDFGDDYMIPDMNYFDILDRWKGVLFRQSYEWLESNLCVNGIIESIAYQLKSPELRSVDHAAIFTYILSDELCERMRCWNIETAGYGDHVLVEA